MSAMETRHVVEKIQDDLMYVIEELLFDRTGEAKSELADILHRLPAQRAVLGDAFSDQMQALFSAALERLRRGTRHEAHDALVDLRRGLRNCVQALDGQARTYPYGTQLGQPGSAAAQ